MCLVLGTPHLEHSRACLGGLRPDVSVLHTHTHTNTQTHTHTHTIHDPRVCVYIRVCVYRVCGNVCVCVRACLCVCVCADITAGELIGAIALGFFAGLGARALTSAHPSAPPVRGWVGGNV